MFYTLVEVGTQKGGSLEMWSEYLGSGSEIIGIDIDPECAKLKYDYSGVKVVIGDQGDPKFWDDFLLKHPKIDIFIDDGGHFMDQQILTFEKVFPTMPIGGIYFCEDCHTSYMPYNGGGLRNRNSFIEYAKSYIDVIHSDWIMDIDAELERRKVIGKDLTSIHFYDSLVVLEKFGKKDMKRVFPKQFS
jgi:cephalosporin hydroxylase